MHEVMTAKQAAEFLQTTEHTVKRRARDGSIPAAKIGREWRFRKADLDRWLQLGGTRRIELEDEGLLMAVEEAKAGLANHDFIPWEEVKARRGL